jgi:hypothetical protein
MRPDFEILNYWTMWLVYPKTEAAAEHAKIVFPDREWLGPMVACEACQLESTAQRLRADGFIVSVDGATGAIPDVLPMFA